MAHCERVIGRLLSHRCGRLIEGDNPPPAPQGVCSVCGIEVLPALEQTPELERDLDFSIDELRSFNVIMGDSRGRANPDEWGADPFQDFT